MTRIRITIWAIGLTFLLLLAGLFNLEVIHGRVFKGLGERNCIRLLSQRGSRGKIIDRNGVVIAGSRMSYDLMLTPQEYPLPQESIARITRVLGKNQKEAAKALERKYPLFSMPVTIVSNLDLKEAVALGQLRLEFPYIAVWDNPVRSYPYSRAACHILGYLGQIDRWRLTKLEDYGYKTKDVVGFGGIEEKYDFYLRDEEGGVSFQVDHRGSMVRTLGFKPPVNGKDVQLTIDIKLQKIVEEAFAERKGAAVIMNPYTGEVMALTSSPGFSPEFFIREDNSLVSRIFNDPAAPLINRAIGGVYPAGSIFKLVVAIAALENKKINRISSFLCQGSLRVGKQDFKCWDTHGQQNIISAIAQSCNVFFYRLGLLVGAQIIHDYATKLGFAHSTGIDLPYEKQGFIPSPLLRKLSTLKGWFDGDTANLSIGQSEVLVTPLQVARMMSVFANGGYLVTPYITKSIDGKGLDRYRKKPEKLNFKQENIDIIKEGLRGTVSYQGGTGSVLSGLKVEVAGKTGTAQAPPKQSHAWFCGFFPFKEPRFVICVLLENGGPGYNSCLIAKKIIEEMLIQGLI
ncbi:MAG: penicillin-binding protein 2 [Candidatus Omnitrophica bacterium]|nr:penicillin-binding protein 2 [Candidatus Omnitrophota bacterium]